jgi:hypothetical protein
MTPAPRLTLAREPELDGATDAVFTPRPDELPDMPDPTPSDILNLAWLKSVDYDEAMRVATAEGRRFDRDARQRLKDAP